MIKLLLPLALALPMFTACGESVDAAKGAAGAAGDAASAVGDKAGDLMGNLKDLDVSSMTPDGIKDMAGKLTGSLTEKLGSVKDLASAETFTKTAGPAIEKLGAMKDKLGAALPGGDAVKTAISGLTSKLSGGDGKVMEMLKPVLDKMTALFN